MTTAKCRKIKCPHYAWKSADTGRGKYIWSLVKQIGWDRVLSPEVRKAMAKKGIKLSAEQLKMSRFNHYLLKTFQVTHLNALTPEQENQVIATLKPYVSKHQFEQCKMLRSNIMAIVSTHGQDKDWLHNNMKTWKYGESLRELGYNELIAVRGLVKQALGLPLGYYSNAKGANAQGVEG